MKVIESIRDYISSCPYLNDSRVNIDWLGAQATEYSIDGTPVQPILKRYLNGSSLRQFNFILSSVQYYGETLQNIANSGFYEDFSAWIEEQNKLRSFPKLESGKRSIKIEVLTTGYLFENSDDIGRYQIQCRLVYYQS